MHRKARGKHRPHQMRNPARAPFGLRPARGRAPPRVGKHERPLLRPPRHDFELAYILNERRATTKRTDLGSHASFQTAVGTRSALFLWTARPTETHRRNWGDLPTKTPHGLTKPSPKGMRKTDTEEECEKRSHTPLTGTGDTRTAETSNYRRGLPRSKRATGGQGSAFTVTVEARDVCRPPPLISKGSVSINHHRFAASTTLTIKDPKVRAQTPPPSPPATRTPSPPSLPPAPPASASAPSPP